jgi:hypothetical protein
VRAPRLSAVGTPRRERRAVLRSHGRADGFGTVDQPSRPRHRGIHPGLEIVVVSGTPLVEWCAGSHGELLRIVSAAMDFRSAPSRVAHATSQPSQAQHYMPSAAQSRTKKSHKIGSDRAGWRATGRRANLVASRNGMA